MDEGRTVLPVLKSFFCDNFNQWLWENWDQVWQKKLSEVESCLLSTSVDENLLPDVHNLIVENIDI